MDTFDDFLTDWLPLLFTGLAATTAIWAAAESRATRRQSHHPPATPYLAELKWYSDDKEDWHPEHGPSYDVRIRYRLVVANVGARPLYLNDLALLVRHDGEAPSTGRITRYGDRTWDVLTSSEIPKKLEPGEGAELEVSYPDGPVEIEAGIVEVAGHPQQVVEAVRGDVAPKRRRWPRFSSQTRA